MNPGTLQTISHIAILIGGIIIAIATYGSYHYGKLAEEYITPEKKEQLAPKIDIKLFPFPSAAPSIYKPPLTRYILGIQNLNKNSVQILDFIIEFNFKNNITEIKQMPLIDTGGDVSVGGVEVYQEKKDGTVFSYVEQPMETAMTRNYSLRIQKVKINGESKNTNTLIFNCERCPDNFAFAGDVIVDLSRTPEFVKKPDALGKYEGVYFYKINGKKFSEQISGNIQDIKKEAVTIREIYKNHLAQGLDNINPNEGTIKFETRDNKWLEKNNYIIEFIPYAKKEDFEIHAYRDKDNIFKVLISNSFKKETILKFADLDKLKESPQHPKHIIFISWNEGARNLYIDSNLVDTYPPKE